ncbi:MAG: glutathione S-transferase family protein [Gammaproteobacteria bacterium]|nr:glutathione S-transferase family protein [Gammaproteobacteria bacterium]
MLTLYIANKNYSSWSLRPWILMRVLDIPFEERLVPFTANSNWEEFRRFSPSGKVPALVTDHGTIWDSLAIAEFLAEQHANVWPAEQMTRAWARSASAEMHSGFAVLRERCSMNVGVEIRLHETGDALRRDIARVNELWKEGLDRFGGPFLAGPQFTAVDAFYCPVAFRVQTYGLRLDAPATAYAQRLLALPPMLEWMKDAVAEPWRDEDHEEDCLRAGTLLRDLRLR